MSDQRSPTDFPPEVARFLFERAQPLLLEFDHAWRLLKVLGEAQRFGFDGEDAQVGAKQLQDLFIGFPLDDAIDLVFVQLPNGRSAHVHLTTVEGGFQVLLLDAQDEHDRQQTQQQFGNEAALIGHQKTRAIAELRQIRSELERQRARLQEANALKNALIATLSHDFRTPLTSIFGYLHLLESQRDATPATQQSLRAVRRNVNYLFTLAENLLEYARADSATGLLVPSAMDLPALVDDLDVMFRPLAREQDLNFVINLIRASDAEPLFDELRVRQILVNLLSNAVRYTVRGGVSATLEWKEDALTIEVRDTGIGIAEELREQVFVAFNKGAQAGSHGAGLGLSIVKRLVGQMHGSLELESSIGEGSCFRIVLPALARAVAEEFAESAETPSDAFAGPRTALVVDDDPDIAHLLEVLLADIGFQVRIVGDATSAVEQALASPPDVLLVDVELPGLSGNTAVFRLRAQGYLGRIVTLSATPTDEARKAALSAGADEFLTKPLNIELFVRTMHRIPRSR